MRTIVPPPTSSDRPGPCPVTCTRWCVDGTGHIDVNDSALQRCRSTVHRVDSLGGGRGGDHSHDHSGGQAITNAAGVYLQAEQASGEPAAYVLGIELGGTEQWARLRAADLRALVTAARTLLGQTAAA